MIINKNDTAHDLNRNVNKSYCHHHFYYYKDRNSNDRDNNNNNNNKKSRRLSLFKLTMLETTTTKIHYVPIWLDPILVRGTVTSHRTRQFSGITWISSARDEKEEEEEEEEAEEEEEEDEDEEEEEEEDKEEAVGNDDDDDDGDKSLDVIECKEEEDELDISLFRIRT